MSKRPMIRSKTHATLHFARPIWTPRGERHSISEGEAQWSISATTIGVGMQAGPDGRPQQVQRHEPCWHIEFPIDASSMAMARECITVRVPFAQVVLSQPLVKLGEGSQAQWVPLSMKEERERAMLIAALPRTSDEERVPMLRAWLAEHSASAAERLAMDMVSRFDEEAIEAAGDEGIAGALRKGFAKRDAVKRGASIVTSGTEH